MKEPTITLEELEQLARERFAEAFLELEHEPATETASEVLTFYMVDGSTFRFSHAVIDDPDRVREVPRGLFTLLEETGSDAVTEVQRAIAAARSNLARH
jgi:hypothetical protein